MKENVIAGKIGSCLKTQGFYMKIPDSFGTGAGGFRFTPVKNFDAFFVKDGKFLAIEYKIERGISFAFDSVRDIQIESLQEVQRNGGLTSIILYVERAEHCIIWTVDQFIKLKNEAIEKGRKSISVIPPQPEWNIMVKERGKDWPINKLTEILNGQSSDERRSGCSVSNGKRRTRKYPRKKARIGGSTNDVPAIHGVRDSDGTSCSNKKD